MFVPAVQAGLEIPPGIAPLAEPRSPRLLGPLTPTTNAWFPEPGENKAAALRGLVGDRHLVDTLLSKRKMRKVHLLKAQLLHLHISRADGRFAASRQEKQAS